MYLQILKTFHYLHSACIDSITSNPCCITMHMHFTRILSVLTMCDMDLARYMKFYGRPTLSDPVFYLLTHQYNSKEGEEMALGQGAVVVGQLA